MGKHIFGENGIFLSEIFCFNAEGPLTKVDNSDLEIAITYIHL